MVVLRHISVQILFPRHASSHTQAGGSHSPHGVLSPPCLCSHSGHDRCSSRQSQWATDLRVAPVLGETLEERAVASLWADRREKTCLILVCALPNTWRCGATQLLFWGRWKGVFLKLGKSSTRMKAESSLSPQFSDMGLHEVITAYCEASLAGRDLAWLLYSKPALAGNCPIHLSLAFAWAASPRPLCSQHSLTNTESLVPMSAQSQVHQHQPLTMTSDLHPT